MILACICTFLIGGWMYMGMETMWDNTSHRSMGLIGGMSVLIGGVLSMALPMPITCILLSIAITALEYLGGIVFNHDYSIWDYRNVALKWTYKGHKYYIKLNYDGQICLPYYFIWLFLSPFIIFMYDTLISVNWPILIEYYQNSINL